MISLKNFLKKTQSSNSDKLSNALEDKKNLITRDYNPGDVDFIPWTNLFYKGWWNFRRLFSNPFKEKKKELRILDQVNVLISEGDTSKVADICEKYISLHRIVENTKARARLEKWVTRLIVGYLTLVGVILIASSFEKWLSYRDLPYIDIETPVLIALLTTTTVNIVALGYILVRGLFHEHEKKDIHNENPSNNKN